MIALIACILAALAGFGVNIASLNPFDLLCFAVSLIALHLAWPVALPAARRA